MALRCERTVGRIDWAKAFASGSCPDAISFFSNASVSVWALTCDLM